MNVRGLKPALLLAIMVGAAAFFIGDDSYWLDTSILIAIYSLMGLSVGVLFGLTGILSVAQASFAAIGAYATAILSLRYGFHPLLSMVAAVALPALFAYPFARLVTRMSPLALALATLLFSHMLDIALREGGDFTGGYIGLSGIPSLPWIASHEAMNLFAWALVAVVVFLYGNLCASSYGSSLRTIKTDALRATADGINVPHMRSMAMSLAAGMAGLGGWLYAHYISYLGPESLDSSVSISILLMAMVGGVGTVLGPVIGAAVLTIVAMLIPGAEATGMFYGGVLLFILLVAPKGLLHLVTLLRRPHGGGLSFDFMSRAFKGKKERMS